METTEERLRRFRSDFSKLQHNREKVPLETLRTKYERAYNTLVAEVLDGADWFYRQYMKSLTFPTHPRDTAGNEWLAGRIAAIEADEKKPGGLVEQFHAALIERLNMEEFEDLIAQSYERRLREAFDPYWQRHNRWIGPPDRRWVYNDITKKFWWPNPEKFPTSGGCWINRDYTGHDTRFPPHIKEDADAES